jgi:methylmalonyl-CoA/ethylmalonyl-CoA epimerase
VSGLPFFGPGAVFDHVGLAVRSIQDLGGAELPVTDDCTQRVSVAFVDFAGLRVELIQPLGDRSPIAATLEKGHPLVHLCFRVPSLTMALRHGRESGMHQLARPVPAAAFDGRPIAWLYRRDIGLIELLEDTEPSVP